MRVLDKDKLLAIAGHVMRTLREELEWQDGARVALVDELPATENPIFARVVIDGEHLQDILSGDGFERLGKRLAFKMLPALRSNGKGNPNKLSARTITVAAGGEEIESVRVEEEPFSLWFSAWERRWADESGYMLGEGAVEAKLKVVAKPK